jgi:hypothetical protein
LNSSIFLHESSNTSIRLRVKKDTVVPERYNLSGYYTVNDAEYPLGDYHATMAAITIHITTKRMQAMNFKGCSTKKMSAVKRAMMNTIAFSLSSVMGCLSEIEAQREEALRCL